MSAAERRERRLRSAAMKRAVALRDRLERVRRAIIGTNGSLGWLRGVTLDALRAGIAVKQMEAK